MPKFENIEQYESTHPESGEPTIVPIAPHSMQAVNYRPRARQIRQPVSPKTEPAFRNVEIEPISVKQMEKEFRQAMRSEARQDKNRGLSGWLRRLRKFILGLFNKKPPPQRKNRSGDSRKRSPANRSGKRPRPSSENRQKNKGEHAEGSGQPRSRRRRSRSGGKGPRKPGPPQGGESGKPAGGASEGGKKPGSRDSSPARKRPSGRPRRNRRPSGGKGSGKSGSGNQGQASNPKPDKN
jgi:hypothetical protein